MTQNNLLEQGEETKQQEYFFAITFENRNKISLALLNKQLTGLFILLLRCPKIISEMRMTYYSEELKVIHSHA